MTDETFYQPTDVNNFYEVNLWKTCYEEERQKTKKLFEKIQELKILIKSLNKS